MDLVRKVLADLRRAIYITEHNDGKETGGRDISVQRSQKVPQVFYVIGDVPPDGRKILLHVETERDGRIELAFPTVDLQHLLTLLLLLGGKAAVKGKFAAFRESYRAQPLPLHVVSLGLDEDDKVVPTLEIGAVVLSLSLTRASMAEIGRTILGITGDYPAS